MGCCGQTRREMSVAKKRNPTESNSEQTNGTVRIAYLGRNSFTLRGTYTGKPYSFSPSNRVRFVDTKDGRVMLRTRYFRRVK